MALSVGGLGFLRPAPGTWGSVPPVAIAWILMVFGASGQLRDGAMLGILIGACLICIAFGRYAETRFSRKDAPEVVADETAGQCLSLVLWPSAFQTRVFAGGTIDWDAAVRVTAACAAAFVLFRVFDIIKLPPARRLERLPAGWGVLMDDLAAGLYAAIVLQAGMRMLA